jgi:molybdopterin-guanine dinucleotide biosynthesis protein A
MSSAAAAGGAASVAAILAGGRGTRMAGAGAINKGLLLVEGQRIIDRQLAVLRPRFAEVLIAANDPAPWAGLGLRVVADRSGGQSLGPIAGLDAVLAALPVGIPAVVCVAGDMPFLDPALLEHLRDAAPGAAALVPRVAGRPDPLLARYARSVAPIIAEQITLGRYAMMDLLARLDVTWVDEPELRSLDPELRSLVNINTAADLARLDPSERS